MTRRRGSCRRRTARRPNSAIVSFVVVSGLAAVAQANPQGGNVVAGAATITSAGRTLTVNQSSNRAIINWQGFSIGAGGTTRLNLPSSMSSILNRVTGADPSLIAGHLSSNGQVYLINPNGIVVGPNGHIDTKGFIASTLNLPNDAFMQGGGMTFKGDSGAGIQVLGSVKASNGDVVLIAAMVDNQGHIAAPNGQAILGAGGEVFYIPDGQSDIVIKAPANGANSISNSGTIAAASVQMKAAGSAYALAVNNSGLVSATGISQHGGRIVLDGGDGDVVQGGTLAAAGGAASVNGGQVTVSGTVDVSAPTGGGSIAVTARKNATVTATARLKASATTRGNGGSITVKAQGNTDVTGSLEAKGGPQGGDGGSAEISGNTVTYHGQINLTAPYGKIGQFLLDPTDVTICFICSLTPADINAALNGSDFTVQADNSITVNTAISSNFAQTLTLDAPNTTLNAGISLRNGALKFANSSATTNGSLSAAGGAITAPTVRVVGNYGTVNLSNAANVIPTLSFIGSATLSGSFTFSTTGALDLQGGTLSAGAISILSAGDLAVEANTGLDSSGTKTLGSVNGTFINRNNTGPFIGTGRNLIYAATDVGLDQDGLGYTQFNPVSIGSDPAHGLANVVYIAHSSLLPTMTITADNSSRVYGTPDGGFSASVSGGTGADLARPVQFQIVGGSDTNAGTYAIQPFGTISSTRALVFANGTLTVDPALLTVTANDVTRLQGSGSPAFSATYSGLVNGDTTSNIFVFFTSQGFSTSPAGTYSVQPFGFSQNPNYQLQFAPGTLTIVPPPPPDPAITVNPLIGTPLQIFGPLAETEVEQFASAFDPPLAEASVLLALKDPTIAPTIMAMIDNFLYAELDAILDKPQSSWTADETAFVNGFLGYINQQRAAAANKAMADYEAWAKATVAEEDAKIKADTGEVQEMEIANLSSSPPVPPPDFLNEVSYGMALTDSQGQSLVAQMGAVGDLESVMNGTADATYLAYLAGNTFSVLGKGWSTFAGKNGQASIEVPEKVENAFNENGTINRAIYNRLPKAQRELIREARDAKNAKSGSNTDLPENITDPENIGTDATKTGGGATDAGKETSEITKDISTTFDTVETIGRVASVMGIVGEVIGVVTQTASTAAAYAQQASYNTAFSAAVTSAMKPLGVSDLKTMMSNGTAMSYMMAEMASGNPNAISLPSVNTGKPDMPLSQILNITKNL